MINVQHPLTEDGKRVDHIWFQFFALLDSWIKKPTLSTYADNAAALTGGLVVGNLYKTATGEVRVVV